MKFMKLHQIITSLLETDLYKFSMGQAIYHQKDEVKSLSEYETTWTFKCRNKNVFFTTEMVEEIREQINAYCQLHFKNDELEYLLTIPWIHKSYVNSFLRHWQPNANDFVISTDSTCGFDLVKDIGLSYG